LDEKKLLDPDNPMVKRSSINEVSDRKDSQLEHSKDSLFCNKIDALPITMEETGRGEAEESHTGNDESNSNLKHLDIDATIAR
jgi:hypothetical protein